MPLPTDRQALVTPLRQHLLRTPLVVSTLLVAVGVAIGLGMARLSHDPHTATTERLTGTVTWSNPAARLIAFQVDGQAPDARRGQTHYSVLGDWVDAAGTSYGTATGYPTCLADDPDDPIPTGGRRVELEVLHQDTGGVQEQHFVVSVRCLD